MPTSHDFSHLGSITAKSIKPNPLDPTPARPLMPPDLPAPYPEHVEEFLQAYERHFGIRLSIEQATEQLIHLLALVHYRQANADHKERQYRNRRRHST